MLNEIIKAHIFDYLFRFHTLNHSYRFNLIHNGNSDYVLLLLLNIILLIDEPNLPNIPWLWFKLELY